MDVCSLNLYNILKSKFEACVFIDRLADLCRRESDVDDGGKTCLVQCRLDTRCRLQYTRVAVIGGGLTLIFLLEYRIWTLLSARSHKNMNWTQEIARKQ